MNKSKISAREFDAKFDTGENVDEFIDWPKARSVPPRSQCIDLVIPTRLVRSLDKVASRRGVTRQRLIQTWIAQKLKAAS